jgi:hypothetical protein
MPTDQQQAIAHSAVPRSSRPPREHSVMYLRVYGDENDDNENNYYNNNVM